jgi:glycosyltransferase involved in cell wall biosynthesis
VRLLFLVSRHETDPRAAGGDIMGSTYARYLAEAGHEVTYLTSSYPAAPRRECRDGVKIVRLSRPELLAWRMHTYYKRRGEHFDLVYEEAIGGARIPFCAPLYVQQPLLTAWYQVNRPLFIQQYGRWLGEGLSLLEKWVARLHRKAYIIALSQDRRNDLLDLGFRPEQVFVVPPVGIDGLPPGHQPPVSHQPLIVWLGKIRRYKRIDHAIHAMQRVALACPDASLVIAGRQDDIRYENRLRQLAQSLGLNGRVRFALNMPEEEKFRLLAEARALILPSPVEGFGIVILEANACGTPAVVSEGVPEDVVVDGYNGLRAPFGDIDGLAAHLVQLLKDESLFQTVSRNATEHVRKFSKARIAEDVDQLFRRVAAGANGQGESPS